MFEKYENRANEILKNLSLSQKIGQLNQVCEEKSPKSFEAFKQLIREGKMGSVITVNTATAGNENHDKLDFERLNELQRIAVEESESGIPIIFGRDVIHGHKTVYPIPLATAASFNPELVEECYRNTAIEASNDGINWTFAPMLDLSRDPRWGRIIESPGEDPYLGASMAKAVVRGFQGEDLCDKDSIVACAKHFLGYGAAEGGRDYNHTEISDYSLYNMYLPAFRAAVNSGVGTVMSSFNDISGTYVNTKKYLTHILRQQLGFEGFVISDWAASKMPINFGLVETRAEAAQMCINAGLDMDMVECCYLENLENLVNEGKVDVAVIDNAVRNVLKIKLACGLFDSPYAKPTEYDCEKHIRKAREIAGESVVLLKNNGVLPIKKDSKIALAGPFVHEKRSLFGSWTLDGDLSITKSIYEAFNDSIKGGKVLCGFENNHTIEPSSLLVSSADVVVLALGENYLTTGEARSVSDISLESSQIELIKRMKSYGKKVIGLFFCGRPLALDGVVDYLDAAIYAWHCGTETANAVCDIIFGAVNPSGKTPVSFPRRTGNIPTYYNLYPIGKIKEFYYNPNFTGSYVDGAATPLYPFGYGLSYTSFEYSLPKVKEKEISLSEIKNGKTFEISVTVKNIGEYDGKETVQLYIRDKVASYIRPLRELKGFQKPFIKKGESVTLNFRLGHEELGFYNEIGDYLIESGSFDVFVGENSFTDNRTEIIIK